MRFEEIACARPRARARYRPRAPFRAWLYRIATNTLHSHRRRQSVRASSPTPLQDWGDRRGRVHFGSGELDPPQEAAEKMERYERLHRAVEGLPRRYRDAVALRYFEELSYAEVAAALGKRVGTVKSLVHRGLRLLRRKLER